MIGMLDSRSGEQGWCSGESTCLPPVWTRFDSGLCHMWVKFDANSRLALRVFLRLLWGPIHTTPEEYENRGFTPKIHQMFFVILDLFFFFFICVCWRLGQTNHLIIVTSSFSKSSVFKMFSVHTKTQSSVFKSFHFQECFRKAPFSVDNFSGPCFSPSQKKKQIPIFWPE